VTISRTSTRVVWGLLALGWIPTLAVVGAHRLGQPAVEAQTRAPIVVTRLYTGEDGKTHAEDIDVTMGALRGTSQRSAPADVSSLQFVRTTPEYFLDWHTAPSRQFIVTLSGQSEVVIGDGTVIRLHPGRVLLVEDVEGQGHLSRAVPGEERVSLFIPLSDQSGPLPEALR